MFFLGTQKSPVHVRLSAIFKRLSWKAVRSMDPEFHGGEPSPESSIWGWPEGHFSKVFSKSPPLIDLGRVFGALPP